MYDVTQILDECIKSVERNASYETRRALRINRLLPPFVEALNTIAAKLGCNQIGDDVDSDTYTFEGPAVYFTLQEDDSLKTALQPILHEFVLLGWKFTVVTEGSYVRVKLRKDDLRAGIYVNVGPSKHCKLEVASETEEVVVRKTYKLVCDDAESPVELQEPAMPSGDEAQTRPGDVY